MSKPYRDALSAGLREFNIKPRDVYGGNYSTQGRRLTALRAFLAGRHLEGAATLPTLSMPEIAAVNLRLPMFD